MSPCLGNLGYTINKEIYTTDILFMPLSFTPINLMSKSFDATLVLNSLAFDFGSPDEYPISPVEQSDLTAEWLATPIELELNTGSTIEEHTPSELLDMATEYISNNSGWLVSAISINWDRSYYPACV